MRLTTALVAKSVPAPVKEPAPVALRLPLRPHGDPRLHRREERWAVLDRLARVQQARLGEPGSDQLHALRQPRVRAHGHRA